MIIDFHVHLFTEDVRKNRTKYLDDKNFSCLYKDDKSKLIDHETLLEAMEESHIDYTVVMGFAWQNKKYCKNQNEYFATLHNISEKKILPFGSVPLDAKNDIKDWVKDISDMGLFGIGEIGLYSDGLNKKNQDYLKALLEGAQQHSLPVCIHLNEPIGHAYTGKYDPSFKELYSIVTNFPDVKIIFAHWGGGLLFYELMPEVSKAFENIYYDTAASPYLYTDNIYKASINITGSRKILFGSDYPLIKFNRYIDSISKAVPDENDRKNILGLNAAKLLEI